MEEAVKIRAPELFDRANQVASEARNAERLAPRSPPDATTLALVDTAVAKIAQKVATDVVAGAEKFRDRDFSFGVRGEMHQAIEHLPKDQQDRVWNFGGDVALQDKLEAEVTRALASRGLTAKVGFSTANYDGMLTLLLSGVRAGAPEPTPEALARVTGAAPKSAAPLDSRTSQKVVETTTRLLDEATALVGASSGSRLTPSQASKLTAGLEKAAKQLASASSAGATSPEIQLSYAKLLYALSDSRDLYERAGAAEPPPRAPRTGLFGWVMDGLAAAKNDGNFEKRVRAAVVTLYDHAPVAAPSAESPRLSRAEQFHAAFPHATAEMLRDPQTLAVFTAVAPQRELATNAELTGSYDRAKHALRSVAGDLSAKLGPTLVTGQAVLDLAELSERFGKDEAARRGYEGALYVFARHLPSDHALVVGTAQKLVAAQDRLMAKLDADKSDPMEVTARMRQYDFDYLDNKLGVRALAAKTPSTDRVEGASAGEWSAALPRAAGLPPSKLANGYQDELFHTLHHAIFGQTNW